MKHRNPKSGRQSRQPRGPGRSSLIGKDPVAPSATLKLPGSVMAFGTFDRQRCRECLTGSRRSAEIETVPFLRAVTGTFTKSRWPGSLRKRVQKRSVGSLETSVTVVAEEETGVIASWKFWSSTGE